MGAGLALARTPDSGCSYGLGARSQQAMVRPTSFVWGPAVGWGCFTVLVLASDGAVYSLCPVAPFGMDEQTIAPVASLLLILPFALFSDGL